MVEQYTRQTTQKLQKVQLTPTGQMMEQPYLTKKKVK